MTRPLKLRVQSGPGEFLSGSMSCTSKSTQESGCGLSPVDPCWCGCGKFLIEPYPLRWRDWLEVLDEMFSTINSIDWDWIVVGSIENGTPSGMYTMFSYWVMVACWWGNSLRDPCPWWGRDWVKERGKSMVECGVGKCLIDSCSSWCPPQIRRALISNLEKMIMSR